MIDKDHAEPDDDIALAARVQRGDRRAYADLVRRHQDGVFRFLLRLTGSREDAHDLAQEAFLRAWQALPAWRPEAKFRTWLFGIAHNAAVDLLRRRGMFETASDEDLPERADMSSEPFARLEATQRLALLERALVQVSAEHREILLLRELENMAYDDLAAALGVNEGTVKSRLARARSAVMREFRRLTGETGDD